VAEITGLLNRRTVLSRTGGSNPPLTAKSAPLVRFFNLMPFYVYIIQSRIDDSFYKGYTEDYFERLIQHNKGLSAYTSRRTPWILVYLEIYDLKREALIREKKLKKYSHEQIQNLILSSGNKCKFLVDEWLKSLPNRRISEQRELILP
jgi:putative endonuclease